MAVVEAVHMKLSDASVEVMPQSLKAVIIVRQPPEAGRRLRGDFGLMAGFEPKQGPP